MIHFLKFLAVFALVLALAGCTKIAIGPDGAPCEVCDPFATPTEVPPPAPDTLPEDASQKETDAEPVILGARHESQQPAQTNRQTSPVVARLSAEAQSQKRSGQLEQALSTTERALRIDPTNPELWLLLGQIQLERGNYVQAEQLARKSMSLAGQDNDLKARNWRVIQEARRRRGDDAGAEDALQKARELEGGLS